MKLIVDAVRSDFIGQLHLMSDGALHEYKDPNPHDSLMSLHINHFKGNVSSRAAHFQCGAFTA